MRPTEAVYTDRKVRGHASKHVVGAKMQGLRAGPQGRAWLEIYYSFSAKSCSRPYVSMTQRIYRTAERKQRRTAYMQQYLNSFRLKKKKEWKHKQTLTTTRQRLMDCVCLAIDWPPSEGPHHSLSCSYVSSSSIHLHLSTALLGLISSMAPLVYIVVNPFITLHVS